MQVLIAISGFCGFCSRIGNTPCTTPFDFLFVISIHIPAWGTTAGRKVSQLLRSISIHVPAWGTTTALNELQELYNDFNPRSRVGNDPVFFQDCVDIRISIHVPAWGTTAAGSAVSICSIFQSTFPRGERLLSGGAGIGDLQFQSTFPRGERHWHDHPECSRVQISIHVPAWGTTLRLSTHLLSKIFQSTFPRGERLCLPCWLPMRLLFQSTFPRGERRRRKRRMLCEQYFNPRSRVGNDTVLESALFCFTISIHVPAWGTTNS